MKNIWTTSQPEHLGRLDPDCVPVLRFLGMSLERINAERSVELSLPEGSILVKQMEYIVEALMKFEPISSKLEQHRVTKNPLRQSPPSPPRLLPNPNKQNTLHHFKLSCKTRSLRSMPPRRTPSFTTTQSRMSSIFLQSLVA